MKIILRIILSLLFSITLNIYAQQSALSTGKAPFNKAHSNVNYGTFSLADIAFANDNSTSSNISMPIPDGHPFTVLGSFTAPNFATSMCLGGDGNYYLLDVAPALYLFDPGSGTCTLIGNITGMGSDGANATGIAFDPINSTYYLTSIGSFYSFDVNTLTATLIGAFTPAITGLMIDLCFDENGTCYAYEVNITAGAANAYIIDINTAALTTLGYVGFTPNYGQGMSYDFDTQTIYLSAFNYDTFTGQLRTMDKNTGATTLLYDWGDQIAPFAIIDLPCCPCPVGVAHNPNPPSGATDISINGITLTWENGELATMVEVWFGPSGNVVNVYDGPLITSWNTGNLEYFTNYHWRIISKNDTCSTGGPTWSFQTENYFNPEPSFYPQSAEFWTGSTDSTMKTDGEINTVNPNEGWAAYDISSIPQGSLVQEVNFYGYVNATYWPYWSATPMGTVNPITDDASLIFNQIFNNSAQNLAYIYSDEASSFTTGWHTYPLGNSVLSDLQAAVDSGQGWFAMGFIDRDGTTTFYLNFDGWSQPNPPYLQIIYATPVELTSFRADVNEGNVNLSWQTATETNNRGFEVERAVGSRQPAGGAVSPKGGYAIGNGQYAVGKQWEKIGFIEGNGTSTQTHSYSFTDKDVIPGKYSYRLKQIDFDGTSEYSKEVEINIDAPKVYSLEQNYPNPFNPSTQINFSLAQDSKVQLKVFDILGREVAVLINKNITAGIYNATFNGLGYPSGVYIYRIEANGSDGSNFTSVRKMVLTK